MGSNLYSYDYVNEGLSQINSPLGETRKYAYEDELENLTRITYGDGTERLLAYGADNRLKTVTLPSGDTIEYQYNSAGQEISRTATKGGTVTTTYTLDGNVDTMTDPTGVTQDHYDPVGRLSGIDYPSGQRIRYTHDVLGQVKTVSTQTRATAPMSTTEYDYDEMGNLKTVKDPLGGITTMSYDDGDRLEERLLPNGVRSIYTYDDLDQVRSIVHENAAGEVLVSVAYERNLGGEPNKITREDGSYVELGYDEALRLERESYYDSTEVLEEEIVYGYDADGKRITRQTDSGTQTYRYDPGYQLVEVIGGSEPERYSFDEDGRVKEIVREGSTLILAHDTYDRLIQANGTSYEYDGMNRRVRSTSPVERNFLVAPAMGSELELIHQVSNNTTNETVNYVYAGASPLMRQGSLGTTYYLSDSLGSVIALADESGQITAVFLYDGFGNLRESGEAFPPMSSSGDLRFHGQWLENSLNLYQMGARDYDSIVGRFISRDPLNISFLAPKGVDPYQFAYNSPVIFVDPTGMFTILGITASNAIGKIVRSARTYTIQEARNYVEDQIGQFLANTGLRLINLLLPDTPNGEALRELTDLFPGEGAGDVFEDFVTEQVCNLFSSLTDAPYIDRLWITPGILLNGTPVDNGIGCSSFLSGEQRLSRGLFQGRYRTLRPDFLFKTEPPLDFQLGNPDSYIIGDFKITMQAVFDDIRTRDGQWLAMSGYASRYQFSRILVYITFVQRTRGRQVIQGSVEEAIEQAIRRGVILFLFNIYD